MGKPDLFVCDSDGVDYFVLKTENVNGNVGVESLKFIRVFRFYRKLNTSHVESLRTVCSTVVKAVLFSHVRGYLAARTEQTNDLLSLGLYTLHRPLAA